MMHKDEHYEERVKIATKAFDSGCIIFAHQSAKYYTPREYVESGEPVESKMYGMDISHNVTLFYPKFALESEMAKLKKANDDFQSFMKKIESAFDFTPIGKQSKT